MDKRIQMLLIKLSQRYKVSVFSFMAYNTDTQRITTKHRLTMKTHADNLVHDYECFSKRDLICEMMKWLRE